PNILKVLNPLFLDDLRQKLEEAGENSRKLLNLRNRMAKIRVFDPACGSGNFLVIAYKQMRAIEAEINQRRGEASRPTDIPLTNFRGIELRDFSAEIARLALIIAEYQCDLLYRGKKLALAEFLPLDSQNWITCGNALRLNWLSICPPTGTGVKLHADDLFQSPLNQAQIDFENEGGETYICGNPPYLGSQGQSQDQKADLKAIFERRLNGWKSLDYVAGWFMKAADYGTRTNAATAFVATNSICQGRQVALLWPMIFATGHEIAFAHTSFKWANLASHNAGVTVAIIGISNSITRPRLLFSVGESGELIAKESENINAYLVSGKNIQVEKSSRAISDLPKMTFGNQPIDGGNLVVSGAEKEKILTADSECGRFIYHYLGSREYINGIQRWCLWINPSDEAKAASNPTILEKIEAVRKFRLESDRKETVEQACNPYQFVYRPHQECDITVIIPSASSERRPVLPCGILPRGNIISNLAFAVYNAPLWALAVITSRLHLVWVGTVCGKLKTDFRYSNTLGWNTFPVPTLTEKNKADLNRCAENILLARETHFPATIADLYDPEKMPADLCRAHEQNDEVLERIYIGRRFKNDTERLEKLFELYAKKTEAVAANTKPGPKVS
ncbi:MAG TPA: lactate dehydrogenase, partial [Pseudohongiella sp.]|nr:lactate dehydrogenase [Pseudohongiella sp.]